MKRLAFGKGGIPHIGTHDGRTVRYPDPEIKVKGWELWRCSDEAVLGCGGEGGAGTCSWGAVIEYARKQLARSAASAQQATHPCPPLAHLMHPRPPSPSAPQVNDTVMLDLETGKIKDFIKFDVGNLVRPTSSRMRQGLLPAAGRRRRPHRSPARCGAAH